jgi:hypothetical protein
MAREGTVGNTRNEAAGMGLLEDPASDILPSAIVTRLSLLEGHLNRRQDFISAFSSLNDGGMRDWFDTRLSEAEAEKGGGWMSPARLGFTVIFGTYSNLRLLYLIYGAFLAKVNTKSGVTSLAILNLDS